MTRFIDSNKMGRSRLGWLDSYFHFSFAEYYNPENLNFGALRVINDDLIQPHSGFDAHPHKDMEIVTYVVDGELTHADSMKNKRTLSRGQAQYMSAGTGVVHSEHNMGIETLRLLQIWILPDGDGYDPNYGDYPFLWEDRENKWLHIASWADGNSLDAPIKIHQDVNIFASSIDEGKIIDFHIGLGRQAYLVLIEGAAEMGGWNLNERDALEAIEQNLKIKAKMKSHIIAIEVNHPIAKARGLH
ncbi:MAG: pirin family protein [Clostridiales bacterium]|nr:pirin family protein [Clostridiales bacterium]